MAMPTPPPARPTRRRFAPRIALVVVAVVLVVLIASARQLAVFYTDKLWFDDLGFGHTWRTLLVARIVPAVIFTLAMFVILLVSLVVADRVAPRFRNMGPEDEIVERYRTFIAPYAGRVRVLVAALFALLVGVGASSQWKAWILYRNRVQWGVKDAQFHKDIGFFVFELPFLRFVFEWLFVVLLVTLLVTAVFHYLNGGIRFQAPYQHVTPQVKAHLSVILALMAVTKTVQYWLGRYELVFSHRGAVDGATYTDVKAQLPALQFLALISVVAAVLFVVNIWQRGWTLPAIAVGLWAFISIVLGTAYPAYVQNFNVKPNELARERKYIARNIDATRVAFGLDAIQTRGYSSPTPPTAAALTNPADEGTLTNVRLWDPATIVQPYRATQEFASFYTVSGADVDRYKIGLDSGQQVLISARNLDLSGLPNDTWTNRHLVYTHGLGAVVATANQTDARGQPSYVVKGVPAQGTELKITRPDIYFGTGVDDFAIVRTKQGEVELADGSGARATTSYNASRGVKMSSFLRRAAFAMRFSDLNVLLSSQVQDNSRVLWVRDPRERAQKAAPFLRFDTDPYLVVRDDGTLTWVVDAYTYTDRYPYSQEIGSNDVDSSDGLGSGYNYVRNSVKVTVDAYDGTVRFYVIDPSDPLVRAYRKAFPDLFQDASAIPRDVAAHFRYPQQMFKVQARQFELYHITKPDDFYNGVNQWAVAPAVGDTVGASSASGSPDTSGTADSTPAGNNGGRAARLRNAANRAQPIYQRLDLPGSDTPETVLTLPYVPVSRNDVRDNNLTSFLVARNDGYQPGKPGLYGQLLVYDTSDTTASPVQAARAIESNQTISPIFSLLRQQGSTVLLGDVQLLPIDGNLLYVRAVFVKTSDPNAFPVLTYVALTDGNAQNTVLGCVQSSSPVAAQGQQNAAAQAATSCDTTNGDPVADALAKFFKVAPTNGGNQNGGNNNGNQSGGGPTGTPKTLLERIRAELDAYQSATAKGDFVGAAQHLANIRKLLDQGLGTKPTTSTTTPSTTPGGSTTTTAPPGATTTTLPPPTTTTTTST